MKTSLLFPSLFIILLFILQHKAYAQEEITCNISTYAQTIERSFCFSDPRKEKVKVICNDEWIKIIMHKPLKACFSIAIKENDDDQERRGTVILKGKKESKIITIIQEGQDITHKFQCDEFKKELMRHHVVSKDSLIRVKNVSKLKRLDIQGSSSIKSFAGIEYFKELEHFNYPLGSSSLARSKFELDFSGNPKLKTICFGIAQVTKINISNCLDLEELTYSSTLIDTIDISQNYNLRKLKISSANRRTSSPKSHVIIFPELGTKVPKLEELSCAYNNMTTLELYKCPLLKKVYCSNNALTNLDLKDCAQLSDLDCSKNQIEYLDLRDCVKLETLICKNSGLKRIKFGDNAQLSYMNCRSNELFELDTSHLKNLKFLSCSYNRLTHLDLTSNVNLVRLYCNQQDSQWTIHEGGRGGLLQELILPDNTSNHSGEGLLFLELANNAIEKLDISKTPNLVRLNCSSNNLKELDVTNHKDLESIDCSYNYIHKLDFRNCPNIQEIKCEYQGYEWVRSRGQDYKLLKYLYLPNQQNTPPHKRLRRINLKESELKNKIDFTSYPELKEVEF